MFRMCVLGRVLGVATTCLPYLHCHEVLLPAAGCLVCSRPRSWFACLGTLPPSLWKLPIHALHRATRCGVLCI
jgi:hypothetical protein